MKASRTLAVCLLASAATVATVAQVAHQAQDEEYARLVKEWTTRPEFMSPLVDHLPKAPGVPTTKDVLGYYSGAPKKLTKTADLGRYYRALAAASKRVKVLDAGATDEGRECLVIAVSRRRDHPQSRHLQRLPREAGRSARPHRRPGRATSSPRPSPSTCSSAACTAPRPVRPKC